MLSCNLQSEEVTVTSAVYPNKALFTLRKDVCLILQKIARLCNRPYGRSVFEVTITYISYIKYKFREPM